MLPLHRANWFGFYHIFDLLYLIYNPANNLNPRDVPSHSSLWSALELTK